MPTLRENWLRSHKAFRLSQEILARKDIELAHKNAQIAQKDAEFAEFRNKWIQAYEAVAYGQAAGGEGKRNSPNHKPTQMRSLKFSVLAKIADAEGNSARRTSPESRNS